MNANGEFVRHRSHVPADVRARMLRQEPTTVWLTGLSGAGKSTIAFELERQLMAGGHLAYALDGDNVRHGLNGDLGLTPADRSENIRRIAEVAHLFNEAGVLAIAAFISPYAADRARARRIVGPDRFVEVYLSTALDVCEQRDPKGFYRKARAGAIAAFTGITAPYEAPAAPELVIDTGRSTVADSVAEIMATLAPRLR